MRTRTARPGDARSIAEIHVDTWRTTYPGILPQEVLDRQSVDAREQLWARALAAAELAVFVAESGGQLVGFASVGPSRFEDGVGELYAIYVRQEAHGSGAGPKLMDAAVAWLAQRWDEATLWVAAENPRARRFYEREGWVVDGERVDDSIPGAVVREARYRLSGLHRR